MWLLGLSCVLWSFLVSRELPDKCFSSFLGMDDLDWQDAKDGAGLGWGDAKPGLACESWKGD